MQAEPLPSATPAPYLSECLHLLLPLRLLHAGFVLRLSTHSAGQRADGGTGSDAAAAAVNRINGVICGGGGDAG